MDLVTDSLKNEGFISTSRVLWLVNTERLQEESSEVTGSMLKLSCL